MNFQVSVQKEWNPLLTTALVVGFVLMIPLSFSEVGLGFDQLDQNLHHIEGALLPKIYGVIRGLVGAAIGMGATYLFAVGSKEAMSAASSGSVITLVLTVSFYFLPYIVAFSNSDWTELILHR